MSLDVESFLDPCLLGRYVFVDHFLFKVLRGSLIVCLLIIFSGAEGFLDPVFVDLYLLIIFLGAEGFLDPVFVDHEDSQHAADLDLDFEEGKIDQEVPFSGIKKNI